MAHSRVELKANQAKIFFAENETKETPMHRLARSSSLKFFYEMYNYWGPDLFFAYLESSSSAGLMQPLMGLVSQRNNLIFLLYHLPHRLRKNLITFSTADCKKFLEHLKEHSAGLLKFIFLIVTRLQPPECDDCRASVAHMNDYMGVDFSAQLTEEIYDSLPYVYQWYWNRLRSLS